MSDKFVLF